MFRCDVPRVLEQRNDVSRPAPPVVEDLGLDILQKRVVLVALDETVHHRLHLLPSQDVAEAGRLQVRPTVELGRPSVEAVGQDVGHSFNAASNGVWVEEQRR